jgi:hypothetical protein
VNEQYDQMVLDSARVIYLVQRYSTESTSSVEQGEALLICSNMEMALLA